MEIALEAGADDVVSEDEVWIITTAPDSYMAVKEAVDAAKLPLLDAKVIMAPSTEAQVPEDKLKSFLKLVDMLEDNDDVQNVWHNGLYDEPED
jgi:transcriptional/translational regulatory protein YebC/TACO1